jgi:hypothetical protein
MEKADGLIKRDGLHPAVVVGFLSSELGLHCESVEEEDDVTTSKHHFKAAKTSSLATLRSKPAGAFSAGNSQTSH